MALLFEWDPSKARRNRTKHGVDFAEAATVFADGLSMTFPDPDHSMDEQRTSRSESRAAGGSWRLPTLIGRTEYASSAPERQHAARGNTMKKTSDPQPSDELRAEYDLAAMTGLVRGKYAKRYKEGSNVIVLAPDVAAAFPNEKAVNEALRLLMNVAKSSRKAG